jgi:Flp pilus assembly protein TadB
MKSVLTHICVNDSLLHYISYFIRGGERKRERDLFYHHIRVFFSHQQHVSQLTDFHEIAYEHHTITVVVAAAAVVVAVVTVIVVVVVVVVVIIIIIIIIIYSSFAPHGA